MAYVSDGSRVCDSNRVALAPINGDVTLFHKADKIIYCCAIDGALGDKLQATPDPAATTTLHWRRAAGTFAPITNTTEVKIAASGTVLSHGTAVDATDARGNETVTFIAGGVEVQGVASSTTEPLIEISDEQSAEWQFALDFSGALDNQAYDFRLVVQEDSGGTTWNVDYLSNITTPPVSIFYDDFNNGTEPNTTYWTENLADWDLVGAKARNMTDGGSPNGIMLTTAAAHAAEADAKVTVTIANGGLGGSGGPVVRCDSALNNNFHAYVADYDGIVSTFTLFRYDNAGSGTQLATTGSAGSSGIVLSIEATGTGASVVLQARAEEGPALILNNTDTSASRITVAGRTGIHNWGPPNSTDSDYDTFKAESVTAPPPPMVDYYPVSDISTGTWTATPSGSFFARIDEVTTDDADYIESAINPVNDTCEVELANIPTPQAGTVSFTVRHRKV